MLPYYTIDKRVGETPLAALERLREQENIPEDVKLAYAGRLDPMASGKLLILAGDECKKLKHYCGFDKEYQFEVLEGVVSDTGDILGLAESYKGSKSSVDDMIGNLTLPYPKFSSKTVNGKPLFMWTLESRLDEIEIPTVNVEIYKLKEIGSYSITSDNLLRYVKDKISKLPKVEEKSKELGRDFRRAEILDQWEKFLSETQREFTIRKYTCVSSSGAYMRTLAEKLGGLALSIHRSKIGNYVKFPFGLWLRKF